MFAYDHSEVLSETELHQEHRRNPVVDAVPPEHGPHKQTSSRNPISPHVPDEATFETFVDGAGI
jgi:hypothetical protein